MSNKSQVKQLPIACYTVSKKVGKTILVVRPLLCPWCATEKGAVFKRVSLIGEDKCQGCGLSYQVSKELIEIMGGFE